MLNASYDHRMVQSEILLDVVRIGVVSTGEGLALEDATGVVGVAYREADQGPERLELCKVHLFACDLQLQHAANELDYLRLAKYEVK